MQTPDAYYRRYHSITVGQPGQGEALASGIRVDRYLLGAQQPNIDERAKLARKVKSDLKILRRDDPHAGIKLWVDNGEDWEEHTFADFSISEGDQLWALLRYPYVGKGSPEAIQVALQLAAVDLPGSPPLVRPEDFQGYCDRWFGLDCNGFVGNYLRHVYQSVHWSDVNASSDAIESNDQISTIWTKFDGIEQVRAINVDPADLNLLVMVDQNGVVVPGGKPPDYGHIMISEPGESAQITNSKGKLPVGRDAAVPAICVVESTKAKDETDGLSGLAKSYYAYCETAGRDGVFTVLRGLNGGLLRVRIKAVGWAS